MIQEINSKIFLMIIKRIKIKTYIHILDLE